MQKNDGSAGAVRALAATYFLMATCGSMTSIAISLHFATNGDGKALVAAILVSGACAQIFLSPLLAPLFDRFTAFSVAQGAAAIEALTLVALCLSPTPAFLIAGNLIVSCLAGLSVPAIFVIAEECSSESHQPRTFSLLDTARLCGGFVGPLLGGVLLDAGTLRVAFAVEIGAVAVSLIVLLLVQRFSGAARGSIGPEESRISPRFVRSIVEAPSLLLRSPRAREALTGIWAAIIFTSIYNVALVFYATQTLHVNGVLYAVIAQAFIVGRIVGARFSSRLSEQRAGDVLVVSGVVMGICIAVPGIVPSLWLCVPLFCVAGGCNALQVSALRLVVVSTVPPEIKPKALSAMGTVNSSAMLIGYVVGAPVVAACGPAAALVLSGVGTAVLTLFPRLLRLVRQVITQDRT